MRPQAVQKIWKDFLQLICTLENLEYANRLIAAGVPTDIHVYSNAVHGFDFFAPDSSVGQRCIEGCLMALKNAFQNHDKPSDNS